MEEKGKKCCLKKKTDIHTGTQTDRDNHNQRVGKREERKRTKRNVNTSLYFNYFDWLTKIFF